MARSGKINRNASGSLLGTTSKVNGPTSEISLIRKSSPQLPDPDQSSPFFTVLPWKQNSHGELTAVLEFCSDNNMTYGYGLFGQCIPGQPSPLIRMQPKKHYRLTLVNNAHIDTNLHTHGLHVSGVGTLAKNNANLIDVTFFLH
jgi:FtsP/CotA-like multicopper oxidase with cupredoxin domain